VYHVCHWLDKILDELMKQFWRLWAKALGEKSGTTNDESDRIACIRTVIVLSYVLTNIFIILGVVRHW
jgi:hypothetical protein